MFDLYGVYKIATNNGYRIGICHKLSPNGHFECLADNLNKEEALKVCSELSDKLKIKEYDSHIDKTNSWDCLKHQMQALGAKQDEIERILGLVSEWN